MKLADYCERILEIIQIEYELNGFQLESPVYFNNETGKWCRTDGKRLTKKYCVEIINSIY